MLGSSHVVITRGRTAICFWQHVDGLQGMISPAKPSAPLSLPKREPGSPVLAGVRQFSKEVRSPLAPQMQTALPAARTPGAGESQQKMDATLPASSSTFSRPGMRWNHLPRYCLCSNSCRFSPACVTGGFLSAVTTEACYAGSK